MVFCCTPKNPQRTFQMEGWKNNLYSNGGNLGPNFANLTTGAGCNSFTLPGVAQNGVWPGGESKGIEHDKNTIGCKMCISQCWRIYGSMSVTHRKLPKLVGLLGESRENGLTFQESGGWEWQRHCSAQAKTFFSSMYCMVPVYPKHQNSLGKMKYHFFIGSMEFHREFA